MTATATRKRPTKRGSLADLARHFILPAGIKSTGYPSVEAKCAEMGVTFDDWQAEAGRAILAKRENGQYACSIGGAVMSIPRQVGKTFLIGAIVFALCLLTPNTTVLWTAHRLRTANETFGKMQAFAGRKRVAPHVAQILLGSGTGEIKFKNGSRILFGARERGFGRGFDDVDVEVFDEAQILTENAIDDMVPATNTAPNPLLFFVGTPPRPTDPSEVFEAKRAEALSGEDQDTLYLEFSADEGCNPLDRKQWKKANVSFPDRTSEAAMLRMKKNLTPESFMREGLGVWDVEADPTPLLNWPNLADTDFDPATEHIGEMRLALDAPPSLLTATFATAGIRSDGLLWVQDRYDVKPDKVGSIVDLARQLTEGHDTVLVVPHNSPALAWRADLEAAGIPLDVMTAAETAAAFGRLTSAVQLSELRHRDQPQLNSAVEHIDLRSVGDVFIPRRRTSSANIAPIVAAMCALYRVPVVEESNADPFVVFA